MNRPSPSGSRQGHPVNPFAHNVAGETLPPGARIGLGAAAFGREGVTETDAEECVHTAWEQGIRYFDVAPMYGSGRAEVRLGRALAGQRRDDFVLSSKVGRLVEGAPDLASEGTGWTFDFSADAIKRSVEASLARLELDRIDILFIHDPDNHWETAITEAWPVLEDLRRQGVVRAVGAGMTRVPLLTRFAQETSMDIFLLAGRYSLLDTEGMNELLPLCHEKGISVLIAQALHGGLIDGVTDAQFHYAPVDAATRAKVERIAAICHAHGIPTAAAAIQFPLAHPGVTGMLTGPATAAQLRSNLTWFTTPIPPELWAELKAAGLLPETAPVPS